MAAKKPKKTAAAKAQARAATKARKERSQREVIEPDFIEPGTLETIETRAPAVNLRAPFFASQLKNVCRTTKVGSKCRKGSSNLKPGADLGLERGYSPEELQEACREAGGTFIPGRVKPIRAGKVELDFLSPAQAKRLETLPGPNIRLCRRDDQKGFLVPVSDPAHAVTVARAFNECVGDKKKAMPACAQQAALKAWPGRKSPPLGALPTRGLLGNIFSR